MRLATARLTIFRSAGHQADNLLFGYVEQGQLLADLTQAIRSPIEIDDHQPIERLPANRLMVGGVMQAQIPVTQQRVANRLLKGDVQRFAGPSTKSLSKVLWLCEIHRIVRSPGS